jgi:hypothetical protein
MSRSLSRFAPLILLVGDLIAVVAFVAVGQEDHGLVNEANPVLGVLLTAGEFGVPWLIAGLLLGAFRTGDHVGAGLAPAQGDHPLRFATGIFGKGRPYASLLARSLNTWLVAAPIGILIRSYALGRAVIPTVFLVATLGFGGMFVLGWRALFALVWWWLGRREASLKPASGD